ncbi:MAG: hypothetical protein AAF288_09435 [Planctomycetota bacterium]
MQSQPPSLAVTTGATAPAQGRWRELAIVLGLPLLLGLLAAAAAARLSAFDGWALFEYAYPLGCVSLAVYLQARRPGAYVALTWWVVFLSPFVRRVVDYHSGWTSASPVILATVLVPGVAALALLRHRRAMTGPFATPFVLAALGVGYGYVVGTASQGPAAATFDLLNWAVPMVFGLYLALEWRAYPAIRKAVVRTFGYGLILTGAYGIAQFLLAPGWDAYWMAHCGMGAIGVPEPLRIRVFSTMNAPGPYGILTACGILLLMGGGRQAGPARWPAVILGSAGLLLSMARTAWLGWAVGALVLIRFAPKQRRVSLLLVLAGVMLCGFLVARALPPSGAVAQRVSTMGDIRNDHSFQDRVDLLQSLRGALLDPVGQGLGSTGTAAKLNLGETLDFDNGVANVPYVLGWIGGGLFAVGVGLAFARAWRAQKKVREQDPDALPGAAFAVATAVLLMMLSSNTMLRPEGLLFWSGIGLVLASGFARGADPPPGEERRLENTIAPGSIPAAQQFHPPIHNASNPS